MQISSLFCRQTESFKLLCYTFLKIENLIYKMKVFFIAFLFFNCCSIALQTKAQQALEVFQLTKNEHNEIIRQSYFLKENQKAKVKLKAPDYGFMNGIVQQIADTFLMIDSQKISYNQISSIAFKKQNASYKTEHLKGLALTAPATVFSSLLIYSYASGNKSQAQSCVGGVGTLIFIPAAIIWGVPLLFSNKTNFDLENKKWSWNLVKK